MISFSSLSKRRGVTLAGVFSLAFSCLLLLCGAGSVPVENFLPQGAMQGDLNAGGYSLTNAATVSATAVSATTVSAANVVVSGTLTAPSSFTLPFSQLTSAPTTLAGYGITDPVALTSGSYANPAWIAALPWSVIDGTPTSFSGYGLTVPLLPANNLSDLGSPTTARTNLGIGSAGVQATSYFLIAGNNFSDVPNLATARSNLGLGSAATTAASAYDAAGAAAAVTPTSLGLVIGTNTEAHSAILDALAAFDSQTQIYEDSSKNLWLTPNNSDFGNVYIGIPTSYFGIGEYSSGATGYINPFNGSASFNGTLTVGGNTTLNGSLTVGAGQTITAPALVSTDGKLSWGSTAGTLGYVDDSGNALFATLNCPAIIGGTGSTPASGHVGYEASAVSSSQTSLTTATNGGTSILTISSVPAGHYLVSGHVTFVCSSATVTQLVGMNTITGTNNSTNAFAQTQLAPNSTTASGTYTCTLDMMPWNPTTTSTFTLYARAAFSAGTVQGSGAIYIWQAP